jgi:hypothetical protein
VCQNNLTYFGYRVRFHHWRKQILYDTTCQMIGFELCAVIINFMMTLNYHHDKTPLIMVKFYKIGRLGSSPI